MFRKARQTYPAESKWAVSTGEHNSKPMFIRRNQTAAGLAGHPDYAFRAGFAIPLLAPDEQGLPSREELGSLALIEDRLVSLLEANQEALQVLSITTGGMRELIFYTRSPQSVETAVQETRQTFPDHELQFYITEDRKWQLYRQFA